MLEIRYAQYPLKYMDIVEKYSEEYGVDKYLLLSLIKTESGFDPNAKSDAEAIGLTQITEITFDWIKSKMRPDEEYVFEDLYNPDTSIRFSAFYLSKTLERYSGDKDTAMAAYHSGWGTVDSLLEEYETEILTEFPYPQMANYVYKINKAYSSYMELYVNTEGEI
ncbi:MAG: lytic transglycosylase domain-containing protein [Oscillospiraceae bacterium]|nr:lytic transglycosylase domain-containing protein [Oscillospiraceae bacterium]